MKKTLLTLLAACSMMAASAEVELPFTYRDNFRSEFNEGHPIPAGWITYGNNAKVTGDLSKYFPNYSSTNAAGFLTWGTNELALFTPSAFESNGQTVSSDQWLISPEFEITDDDALLVLTVCTYGNKVSNNYKILLSEGGTAKEDFTNELLSAKLLGAENSINTGQRRIVISGMKGKKARMAFVNTGNTSGMMGISNVSVGSYYINFTNLNTIENLLCTGENIDFDVRIGISTPTNVKGVTAVVKTDNGWSSTYTSTTSISKNKVTSVGIVFPETFDLKGEPEVGYTVEITPNGEGYPTSYLYGKIINAPGVYDKVVVVEEITGTWCGWCPRGIAYMNYFQDKYNVDGKHRVIPIMGHGGDPMQCDYGMDMVYRISDLVGSYGFPMVMLNRASVEDPGDVPMADLLAEKAYARLKIYATQHDFSTGGDVTVRCGSELSFSATENMEFGLAIGLMENGVKGNNSDYDQADYYGQYSLSDIVAAYGSEVAPYFKDFVNVSSQSIPYSKMVFNEVARGIYPSFDGEILEGAWKAGERRFNDISFKIPSNVNNPENCAVVAMLIRESTGEIVAADIMDASEWVADMSEVKNVAADNSVVTVRSVAGGVEVNLVAASDVAVYSVDGKVLYSGALQAGSHVIPVEGNGMVIVKAAGAAGEKAVKVAL